MNGAKALVKADGRRRIVDGDSPTSAEVGVTLSHHGSTERAVEDICGHHRVSAALVRIGRADSQDALREQPSLLRPAGSCL